MKSKHLNNLLRFLLYAVCTSAGTVLAFLCVQVHDMTSSEPLSLLMLIVLYVGLSALGILTAHLVFPKFTAWWGRSTADVEKRLEALTTAQLISMGIWLMGGLLVASLLTQILCFLGDSMFTMAVSATLYVVLGVLGLTIGAHRADDMVTLMSQGRLRRPGAFPGDKVLDASALADGRILAIWRTGILHGRLVTADFVLRELQEMTESADTARRLRGQRGLETVRLLQTEPDSPLLLESTDPPAHLDPDVALMSLARERNAMLITADAAMHRAARVAGLTSVNLHDLANALRSTAAAGDVLTVRLTKEGREAHQGVGYLEDGTMLVVENASAFVGRTVSVTVTSVLQTSAGRMVFAKLNNE